jgi:hypothetical protein
VARGAVWLSTDDDGHGLYRVDLESGTVARVGTAGHRGGEGEGIDATSLPDGDVHVLTIAERLTPVYFGHFAVGEPVTDTTEPPTSAVRPSASDDLDPGWPPVLIAAVLAVLAAALVIGATFYRRARAAARGD